MHNKVIEVLSKITQTKTSKRIHPTHATTLELLKEVGNDKEFFLELRRMVKSGEVKMGNTLNEKWFILTNHI